MVKKHTHKISLSPVSADAPADIAERTVRAAEVSLRMEEFLVTDDARALCRRLLAGEITFEQYFADAVSMRGVGAWR